MQAAECLGKKGTPRFCERNGAMGSPLGFQLPIGNAIGRQQAAAAKVVRQAGQSIHSLAGAGVNALISLAG